MSRKLYSLMSLMLFLSVLLMACQPTEVIKTVEVQVPVVQTQVVTQIVAGTPQNVIITATPAPTKDMSKEPVSLRFTVWTANETQLKLLNDIAAEYIAMNPNVTIKVDSAAFDDYVPKISIQLAGGDPPDAGWMLETAAANWIKAGALSDLAPKLKSFSGFDFEDFSQPALSFWVRDQAVYGVPFSTSPFFVMYNADLFQAAGIPTPDELIAKGEWTFEKFAESAKAIQDKGGKDVYGWNGIENNNMYANALWTSMTPFVWAYGGKMWSDDYKTCLLNSSETVQALQLVQKMVMEDKSVVPPGTTAAFSSGTVGMSFGQLSRVGPLKDATFKWGLAPMPSGSAGYNPTIGQAAVVAFKASKNVAWAQDFVAFLTTKDNVTKMATFWPPARKSVLNAGVMAKNNPNIDPTQIQAAITDSIINGKVVASHPDFAKVDLAAKPFFDKIWIKDANVQELMDQACTALAPYFK